ncbi:DUF3560 domain-containing protein [Niastella populi]|uniref:Uncharacterized protein n=1 Tax=Niastella populi TaxID=550983 RepID=A0A1V9GAJ1_9BACT|nr:DUF3560 domain-containing protein [Niastella populi]OQP67685.1 hypothetical protein A4R26_11520 [Niastella populi]
MTKDRARIKAAQYVNWAAIAEKKSKEIYDSFQKVYGDFDWTQPILLGHYSQRSHEKVYERREAMHNKINILYAKAKRFREKAENLLNFANRNKGDAEVKRIVQRAIADTKITVGSAIIDWVYGSGIVQKVNKKTYTIKFTNGLKTTRDKSYIKI